MMKFYLIIFLCFSVFANERRCVETMDRFLSTFPPRGQVSYNNPGAFINKTTSDVNSGTVRRRLAEARRRYDQADAIGYDPDDPNDSARRENLLRRGELRSAASERLEGLSMVTGFYHLFNNADVAGQDVNFTSQTILTPSTRNNPHEGEQDSFDAALVALQNGNHTEAFMFRGPNRHMVIGEFNRDCSLKRLSFYNYPMDDYNRPSNDSTYISSITGELCQGLNSNENQQRITRFISQNYGSGMDNPQSASFRAMVNDRNFIRFLIRESGAVFPEVVDAETPGGTQDDDKVTPALVERLYQACENYSVYLPARSSSPRRNRGGGNSRGSVESR